MIIKSLIMIMHVCTNKVFVLDDRNFGRGIYIPSTCIVVYVVLVKTNKTHSNNNNNKYFLNY